MEKYFVSYTYMRDFARGSIVTSSQGFGSEELALEKPIKNMNDVRKLEEKLRQKYDFNHVIILNWRTFEEQFQK